MNLKRVFVLFLLILGSLAFASSSPLEASGAIFCHSINGLPDLKCTSGVVAITDSRIICSSSYSTKTVRPSTSYTNKLKIQQLKQYDYKDKNPKNYEEDHLIPLELGGSPTDTKNLWPEAGASPNPKDKIENSCHQMVCSGKISLIEAQKEISTNWHIACQNALPTISAKSTSIKNIIPTVTTNSTTKNGATALCKDGSYYYAVSHRGACSHHGGVKEFYK